MTVRRQQSQVFQAPCSEVVEAIRSVLMEKKETYRYCHTVEAADHLLFDTVAKPSLWPLFLATKIAVYLHARGTSDRGLEQ
jgi:hypothetical protein